MTRESESEREREKKHCEHDIRNIIVCILNDASNANVANVSPIHRAIKL